MIFANLINGGAHADSNLDIQEYMAIAIPVGSIAEMVERVSELYKNLGDYLKKEYELKHLDFGDEAGYVLDFKNNFEPIKILEDLIKSEKFEKEFSIGLDAAASNFYKDGSYGWEGKIFPQNSLKTPIYSGYFEKIKNALFYRRSV